MTDMTDREREAVRVLMDLGGFDGDHHKQFAMDQAIRILTQCPVVKRTAKDWKGAEYEYEALGESDLYKKVIQDYCGPVDEDGYTDYEWDEGIAP